MFDAPYYLLGAFHFDNLLMANILIIIFKNMPCVNDIHKAQGRQHREYWLPLPVFARMGGGVPWIL